MKISKSFLNSLTVLILASAFIMPGQAATADLFAVGVTSPGGVITFGNTTWVSDHNFGFCKLVPSLLTGRLTIDPARSACVTGPVSPGQPSFDGTFIYVPDNAAVVGEPSGVWRLEINPAGTAITNTTLIANISLLGNSNRPTATALDDLGNLYVGFIGSGNIARITNPKGIPVVNPNFGTTSDGKRPVNGLAFIPGQGLFLAEAAAVSRIADLNLGGTANAEFSANLSGLIPTAIASDGVDKLFIANTPVADSTILRFTVSTDALEFFAFNGILNGKLTPLTSVTSLSVDAPGNLFIGDDPTDGLVPFAGRIWQILAGALPETVPPPTPAFRNSTLYAFGDATVPAGLTSPAGMAWLGSHLWVSDHFSGFCRLDRTTNPIITFTLFTINLSTCIVNGGLLLGGEGPTSPGQPTFDGSTFVYVPDNAAVRDPSGIWRLRFDPATETITEATVIAGITALGNAIKPTATALGPDGKLYVGFIRSGLIKRITNPAIAPAVEAFGNTSDGFGVSAITFAGNDLYLAEGAAVTKIGTTGGAAAAVTGITAAIPTAIASFGTNTLFIADTPAINSNVLRFTISTGTQDPIPFASSGFFPPVNATLPFQFVTGLAFNPQGDLFVGDDASGGTLTLQGHVWNVSQAVPILPPPAKGNITGTVTSAAGVAIAGATVTAGGISATTDAAGKYTISIAPGNYSVTASAAGFAGSSADVTVPSGLIVTQNFALLTAAEAPVLTAITITPGTATVASGTTAAFTAAGRDQNNNPIAITPAVAWSSSDTAVGTIDAAGVFTAGKAGSTVITARNGTAGTVQGTATAIVTPGALASIAVLPGTPTVNVGATLTFTATGADAAGNAVSITPAWSSSDTAVGTIGSVTGLFSAGATGTTTVSATAQSIVGGTIVTVSTGVLNGIINGVVRSSTTNLPVPGATVNAGTASAVTNASGAYSLSVVPATYALTASAAGFVTNTTSLTVDAAQTVIHDFALQPVAILNITSNRTNITTGIPTTVIFIVTGAGTPVSGVTVTLGGSATGAGTTDAAGTAALTVTAASNATVIATASLAGGTPATTVLVAKGDVAGDGIVNVVDALFIAQHTVGIRTVNTIVGDVNGDGTLNIVDALFIAQFTVGIRTDPTTG